jgi:hypothetical protein
VTEEPSIDEIRLMVSQAPLKDEIRNDADFLLNQEKQEFSISFLTKLGEDYFKSRAFMLAIYKSIDIAESGKDLSQAMELMSSAVSFTFNTDLGLDYFEDVDRRMETYTSKSIKIPFKVSMLNLITGGGMEASTLNVFTSPSGFGKTILMMDDALDKTKQGLNVAYFTFEMSDERLAKRADVNDLDMSASDLYKAIRSLEVKFKSQKTEGRGKLFIKEFAPRSATPQQVGNHVKRLEMAKGIKIHVVYVDYINIVKPMRANSNKSYEIQSICEDMITHIAKRFKIPVVSATQLTRSAQSSGGDVGGSGMVGEGSGAIADSIGLINTADLVIIFSETPELKKLGMARGKQVKNRYGALDYYNTFLVGLNRGRMRFYDVDRTKSDALLQNLDQREETPASEETSDASPLFDMTNTGEQIQEESRPKGGRFTNFRSM